jgi:hypothetical protein
MRRPGLRAQSSELRVVDLEVVRSGQECSEVLRRLDHFKHALLRRWTLFEDSAREREEAMCLVLERNDSVSREHRKEIGLRDIMFIFLI